ncbi:glutamate--tRNA ligase [Ranunculus cassubicifolius]
MKEMAESFLLQGKAYVDDSPKEILVQQCRDGIESKCRNHTLEENMHLWKEMVAGSDVGRQCRLRGKLDMHYQHRCDQDPVYYSCKPDTPHHLAGRMYNVYPSCLFASSFVDSELNVTHILQSSENSGRTNAVYHRLRQDMGMPSVQSYDYEPMHMEYTLCTAKEHRYFVENQKVNGWLDLRLPTVPSLRRRGVSSQALKQFFLEQGLKKKQDLVEWESLWSINSQMIFTKPASFHTVLHRKKYVAIILENSPKTHKTILVHVEATSLIEGKTLTLAYSNDVIVKSILKDKDGNFIQVRGVITEECTKTLTPNLWLSTDDPITSLWLVEIDHLITKKKVQPGEDLNVNPSTKKITTVYGGPKMRIVQRGEIVRLARMGYYICDEPFVNPIRPVVLIFIPGPDPKHPMFQVSNDDPWNSTGKTKEGKAPTSK